MDTNTSQHGSVNTEAEDSYVEPTEIVTIEMRDGVRIAAAIYLPKGDGQYPTLFAASPYRFDNNKAPACSLFLWRETGPVSWYNENGYAFVHMDVRGSGRSEGEFRYSDADEQRDLYEVIEWIAKQKWSNGKVGGIGQSYYARMQWLMAAQKAPSLACIAPYDAVTDVYRWNAYIGGISGVFIHHWWDTLIRPINLFPAEGPSRTLEWDFSKAVREHPNYDEFWKERSVTERLSNITIPVFSIGVWGKVDTHLNSNLMGYKRVSGPKKLLLFGGADVYAAAADFASIAFHEKYLLPFYDMHLKGKQTSFADEPEVRYYLPGSNEFRSADSWPLKNIEYTNLYFGAGPSNSLTSLNDGVLHESAPEKDGGATTYSYPDPGWKWGVVGTGPDGKPDPVRRILTFVTEPFEDDVEANGPLNLVLYASSTAADTNFIVKLSEQFAQSEAERDAGEQPKYRIVTKGWLRASHRELDPQYSMDHWPYHTFANPQPLEKDEVYRFDVSLVPTANLFKKGNRLRVEIANGDSSITDFFYKEYFPNQLGSDTIHHSAEYPSRIEIPFVKS